MCTGVEPMLIYGLLAASTIVTAGAAKAQGDFQGDLAERNAESERMRGEDVKKQGLVAEEQHRAKVRQIIGQQRAALGASNLDINVGSAGKLQEDTTRFGEQDALTLRSNAERSAWGINVGAESERLSGGMAKQAGTMSAFSTVLAGGAQAYGRYKPGPSTAKKP